MKTATSDQPIRFTEIEVRSFLPTGWDLLEGPEGAWNAKKRTWTLSVIDNVDFDWPVVVHADEAAEHGRHEALRRAFDRAFRERLG